MSVCAQAEMRDLLTDLKNIPKNAAIRKVNELVKRVRLAKAHMCIIGHLKKETPLVALVGPARECWLRVRCTWPVISLARSRLPLERGSCLVCNIRVCRESAATGRALRRSALRPRGGRASPCMEDDEANAQRSEDAREAVGRVGRTVYKAGLLLRS